jgi:hypothetical protein
MPFDNMSTPTADACGTLDTEAQVRRMCELIRHYPFTVAKLLAEQGYDADMLAVGLYGVLEESGFQ